MRLTVYFPEDSPTTHEFVEHKLTVGRLGENDICLDEGSVSGHHARIVETPNGVILEDLGSTNGTFLNGEQVQGSLPVGEGDEIYFGNVRSVFMEAAVQENPAPIPVSVTASAEPGGPPSNFRSLSPLPAVAEGRDVFGLLAWTATALAVLAALYAVFVVLTL
jgi:hypothetical protein